LCILTLHHFTLLQVSLHIHTGIVFDQPNITVFLLLIRTDKNKYISQCSNY